MRVYLASSADELQEFLHDGTLEIPEVYAPTSIYRAAHSEMDEEEVEYALSLLAAEDAIELKDDTSGAALVIAFEIPIEFLGHEDEVSIALNAPIDWKMVEALFLIGSESDDLTWFAPQEVEQNLGDWLAR